MTGRRRLTLLQLVIALRDDAENDEQLVDLVVQLVNSGQVALAGSFAGARLESGSPSVLLRIPSR